MDDYLLSFLFLLLFCFPPGLLYLGPYLKEGKGKSNGERQYSRPRSRSGGRRAGKESKPKGGGKTSKTNDRDRDRR